MFRARHCVVLAAAVAVAGCQTTTGTGTKEDTGTLIGTLGGALLGAAIGGGDKRWLGAAVGAAVGFYAGKMIGRHLDERDRQALAARTVEALDAPSAGVASWQSERTGASAQIQTGEVRYTSRPQEVKRLSTVQAVPNMRLESREYQTKTALRVRSGPGTQYQPITTLQPGDVVQSAGRTDNGWLMLAKRGVTVGYVHAGYVTPFDPVEQARAGGIDLDQVDVAAVPRQEGFAGIDLDSMETVSSTVTAQTGCREVQISVRTDQGTEQETTQACQNAAGVWELG